MGSVPEVKGGSLRSATENSSGELRWFGVNVSVGAEVNAMVDDQRRGAHQSGQHSRLTLSVIIDKHPAFPNRLHYK